MPDGQHFAFLALARELGLLGPEAAAGLVDSPTPALRATVERKLLSPETARGVLSALEQGYFQCPGCALSLRYGHLGTLPSLACPTCGRTLAYREPSGPQPPRPSERPPQAQAPLAPHQDHHSGLRAPPARQGSDRQSGLGPSRQPSDRQSGLGPARQGSDRQSGLGPSRQPSDRQSGLGPARQGSDRQSGLGPSRQPSDRQSGLGPARQGSDRQSGLGPSRQPSDRQSGLGPARQPSDRQSRKRDSSRRAHQEGPKQIGDFILERQLGRGNNGVVYLARRSGLDRLFAVKILLHTAKLGDEARQRFRLEAQIGSKLSHPGIVPVYDIGEENNLLFFAMEYVEGEDLAQRLARDGRLTPSLAAGLIRDLAEGLAEAHSRQVIHRDLKPGNILLPRDGSRPRLTDFGLARDRELAETMTKSGDILGTPFYMAPEQLQGARITVQADVYALGVILYQCLTGRRPYEAKTPFDLAKRVMAGTCVAPRQIKDDIPADLEAICLRAIHVDPRRRTPSAAALSQELGDFLGGRPVQSATPGSSRPLGTLLLVGGSLLALVLGIALTLAIASGLQGNEAFEQALLELRASPPASREALAAQLARLETLDADDERLASAKSWGAAWEAIWQADRAIERGTMGEAKGALEGVEEAAKAGPFLAEARADRLERIRQSEILLSLEAEVRGGPLTPEIVGRWRELRAQVTDPGLRARVQALLLRRLADRHCLAEFVEESASLEGSDKAAAQLTEAWIRYERGSDEEALTILASLAGQKDQIPESTRLGAAALIQMLRQRREAAIPLFRAALREDPGFVEAKFWLAITLAITGRVPESERLLSEVSSSMSDNASYSTWRARIYLSLQKSREGQASADRALKLLGDRVSERALAAALLAACMGGDQKAASGYVKLAKRRFKGSSQLALLEGLHLRDAQGDAAALKVWAAAWKRAPKAFEASAKEILASQATRVLAAIRDHAEGRATTRFFLPLGEISAQASRSLKSRAQPIANAKARDLVQRALIKLAKGQPYEDVAKAFTEARALAPQDATLAWLHAEALLGRDHFEAAEAALATCRRLGIAERRIVLLESELATRRGEFRKAMHLMQRLATPDGSRDVAWFCARATLLSVEVGDRNGIERALKLLQACENPDRFLVHTFIRISFQHPDRRHVRRTILSQFAKEGLFDTGTLTFYCFEQSKRLGREEVPRLLGIADMASKRLFKISKGAWGRLGLSQILLLGRPKQGWVLHWISRRLEDAGHLEPNRPRLHVLRGVLGVLTGRPIEELYSHWDRAVQLRADSLEFAGWAKLLGPLLKGADLSRYSAPK